MNPTRTPRQTPIGVPIQESLPIQARGAYLCGSQAHAMKTVDTRGDGNDASSRVNPAGAQVMLHAPVMYPRQGDQVSGAMGEHKLHANAFGHLERQNSHLPTGTVAAQHLFNDGSSSMEMTAYAPDDMAPGYTYRDGGYKVPAHVYPRNPTQTFPVDLSNVRGASKVSRAEGWPKLSTGHISIAEAVRRAASMDVPAIRKSSKGGWTLDEDDMLRVIVMKNGGRKWKNIAQILTRTGIGSPRTEVQCLHRWQKVLQPGLKKGPWTANEDRTVTALVERLGANKWSAIAEKLPGRIGKQCRERWFNHLHPDIKKDPWSAEEETILMKKHAEFGNKWVQIAKFLPGRTDNAVKNHCNGMNRRSANHKMGKNSKKTSDGEAEHTGNQVHRVNSEADGNANRTSSTKSANIVPRRDVESTRTKSKKSQRRNRRSTATSSRGIIPQPGYELVELPPPPKRHKARPDIIGRDTIWTDELDVYTSIPIRKRSIGASIPFFDYGAGHAAGGKNGDTTPRIDLQGDTAPPAIPRSGINPTAAYDESPLGNMSVSAPQTGPIPLTGTKNRSLGPFSAIDTPFPTSK